MKALGIVTLRKTNNSQFSVASLSSDHVALNEK